MFSEVLFALLESATKIEGLAYSVINAAQMFFYFVAHNTVNFKLN